MDGTATFWSIVVVALKAAVEKFDRQILRKFLNLSFADKEQFREKLNWKKWMDLIDSEIIKQQVLYETKVRRLG